VTAEVALAEVWHIDMERWTQDSLKVADERPIAVVEGDVKDMVDSGMVLAGLELLRL
jgi:hypothetical protein